MKIKNQDPWLLKGDLFPEKNKKKERNFTEAETVIGLIVILIATALIIGVPLLNFTK